MLGIHPTILFIVIKNMIMFSAFYLGGASTSFLSWWLVGSAAFYALAALNTALRIEQRLEDEKFKEPGPAFWNELAVPFFGSP
jgi:hypothetical protein